MKAMQILSGRASSLPGGLAFGVCISTGITFLGIAILTWMLDREMILWEKIGYGIMITLLLASFLGALAAYGKIKRQRLAVCLMEGAIYFALLLSITALFFASHRWGNGGDVDYEAEAQRILAGVMAKDGSQGVYNMFDRNTKLITFVPAEGNQNFTDPSYNLPAFFELWARWSDTNQDFWAQTAQAARDLLAKASHPKTGLFPDYSTFDGRPFQPDWKTDYDARRYQFDAIRCAMNVGMDAHWFGTDLLRQKDMMTRLLKFFQKDGYTHGQFDVNGANPSGSYTAGMAGSNAVGCFALEDKELIRENLKRLWNTPLPVGPFRYYTGMVYMLSMLHVTGNFKIYAPASSKN